MNRASDWSRPSQVPGVASLGWTWALLALPGVAQTLSVLPHVLPGGGGASSGTRFAVVGSIGQPAASNDLHPGDPFDLRSGFWAQILRWQNTPPRTTDDQVARRPGEGAHVLIRQLLRNDADPDFDTLTLASFDAVSSLGGSVYRDGPWLIYQPPPGAASEASDSFAYRITDGEAGPVSGTVLVGPFIPSADGPPNPLSISLDPGPPATLRIRFQGIAGRSYLVQTSGDPAGPWTFRATVTGLANGAVHFADTPTSEPRFYRLAEP